MNDAEIEREIKAKGLTAARVTPERLDACIASEKARDKIWPLEGYLLKQQLFDRGA